MWRKPLEAFYQKKVSSELWEREIKFVNSQNNVKRNIKGKCIFVLYFEIDLRRTRVIFQNSKNPANLFFILFRKKKISHHYCENQPRHNWKSKQAPKSSCKKCSILCGDPQGVAIKHSSMLRCLTRNSIGL